MKKNVITILKQKENLFIFCLFLLFFPLKTQLSNFLIFAFDTLFRDGITFKVFSLNYKALYVGCEEVAKILQLNTHMNWFQKHGIYYILFLPSLVSFGFLFYRWKKEQPLKLFDWFLTIIACFSILTSINDFFNFIFSYANFSTPQILRILPTTILFLLIGTFIFIRIFSFKQRLQTFVFGVLGFYSSYFLWMKFLGPKLLPMLP